MMRLVCAVVTVGVLAMPVYAQEIDSGSDKKKKGETTAEGSYRIFKDGDKVKVEVFFKTKKTGITGDGKGVMSFFLADSSGKKLFEKEKGFSVGSDVLKGVNVKEYKETFTLFGAVGKKLADEGGAVAFRVEVEKDSFGFPTSPNEWKKALGDGLPDIVKGLGVGKSKDVGGWIIKRIIK